MVKARAKTGIYYLLHTLHGEALMSSSESVHKHSSEIRLLKIVACGLPAGYLTCLTKHSQARQASLQPITLLLSKGIRSQTFVASAVRVKERPNCNKSVAFDVKLYERG